jgi:hypothetical protein
MAPERVIDAAIQHQLLRAALDAFNGISASIEMGF